MKTLKIEVDKYLLDSQCTQKPDFWIIMDCVKQTLQMYCTDIEDERRVKYNFVKSCLKKSSIKSSTEFWNRIVDVRIEAVKDEYIYNIVYDFNDN